MLTVLKRLLWPLRPRNHHREFERFFERMDQAKAYGIAQQQQTAQRRASRDFAETMAVPPVWRKQGGNGP